MTTLARRVVHQHGFLVALVAGLVVAAVRLLQAVLGGVVGQLGSLGAAGPPPGFRWAGLAEQFGTVELPLSIGVIVALWFIAPIGPDLHVVHVVTRSVLAAGVGAVLVLLTLVLRSALLLVTTGLMGQLRFGQIAGEQLLWSFGYAIATAGSQFLDVSPLVILVGVLLRIWLERHPSKHEIVGVVDTA